MATSEPSQDENLDEFWIILNPPLLPSGVEEIIQFVNESLLVGNNQAIFSAVADLTREKAR
jgi:hypothetical protein